MTMIDREVILARHSAAQVLSQELRTGRRDELMRRAAVLMLDRHGVIDASLQDVPVLLDRIAALEAALRPLAQLHIFTDGSGSVHVQMSEETILRAAVALEVNNEQ